MTMGILGFVKYGFYSALADTASNSPANPLNQTEITTLDQLLSIVPAEIEQVDIARMNLICAQGLKGSEDLNLEECLRILDQWADEVKTDTQSRTQAFHDNPTKYDNSVNLFKVTNMILTLKNQIQVDYNQEIMKKTEFQEARDFFLHGCLTGNKQGGCISIPTLCVAVGRRLGYPLKLVLTREHVFFRWDDGKEVFNMEACCPGCDTYPDDYYRNWPHKINEKDVKLNDYLRSLTPAEELGLFLETRGHCLYDNGKIEESLVCYAYAYKLMSNSVSRLANINKVLNKEVKKFQELKFEISRNQK